jgi:hypothetical protein
MKSCGRVQAFDVSSGNKVHIRASGHSPLFGRYKLRSAVPAGRMLRLIMLISFYDLSEIDFGSERLFDGVCCRNSGMFAEQEGASKINLIDEQSRYVAIRAFAACGAAEIPPIPM